MSRLSQPTADSGQSLAVPELIQGDWTSLVILTYTAQLGFFDAHLLRQLVDVPQRLILADDRRLADTFRDAARTGQQLSRANRTYLAAGIRNSRAAHGKAVLLMTANRGRLLVGSGNLGHDGYATGGELWNVYEYSDKDRRHVAQFAVIRSLLDGICELGWLDPPVVDLIHQAWGSAPWLPEHIPAQPASVPSLHHNLNRPLVAAFSDAITWPVRTLTAYAPFFDPDAAALAELIKQLKPDRLRLLLTRNTSIDLDALRSAVSCSTASVSFHEVRRADDPRAFLHAKFVHAAGDQHEAALTGSANLSRSALLQSAAAGGNLELGIIEVRPREGFEDLYAPLILSRLDDPASLELAYRPSPEPPFSSEPVLLWSELRGQRLSLVFDRPVTDYELTVFDQRGQRVTPVEMIRDDKAVYLQLQPTDLENLARGGRIDVQLARGADVSASQTSWPYHTEVLETRLDRAARNDRLTETGALPAGDAELYDLLRQLEQTLITDPVAVWTATRPEEPVPASDGEGVTAIRWEDLDWDRLRRHPRYAAYHNAGRRLPPTDVQRILAAIAGYLGDLGAAEDVEALDDTDDDLGQETSSAETDAEEDEDDGEDEDSRPPRHLSVSTRTRMAYTRFITRYTRAVRDSAFQEALGPTIAVQNAAIFNHLLRRLLQRDAVQPDRAIDAQLAVWTLLWGSPDQPGLMETLQHEERDGANSILARARAHQTVLGALSDLAEYDLADLTDAIRQKVHHLLVAPTFGFDVELVRAAAPNQIQARALVANLRLLAAPTSDEDAAAAVVTPWSLTRASARWSRDEIQRAGARGAAWHKERVHVLHMTVPVDGLTADVAQGALARLLAFSDIAEWGLDYFRIRFATGSDVCFWDAAAHQGLCLIGKKETEFWELEPTYPLWYQRLLSAQDQRHMSHESDRRWGLTAA
ncbi:hypothetical protein ABZ328_22095 [Micromonospora aurantiaca]|uniref:hypothetical protein n=1 Tax=Micromonospora aurantiaca (nom. illeg.) TaxID=47850 RepID=UPI0033CACE33